MTNADFREETCCLLGHRFVPAHEELNILNHTEEWVRNLVQHHGIRYFGVSGSVGYGLLAADKLFHLKSMFFPQIRIILVNPFQGHAEAWKDQDKRTYDKIVKMADKVVYVSESPCREAYQLRDQHLIDCSSHCICYLTRQTGGTAYAVGYAKHRGLEIHNAAGKNIDIYQGSLPHMFS